MTLKLTRTTGSHPQHGKGLPGSETGTCEGSTGEVEGNQWIQIYNIQIGSTLVQSTDSADEETETQGGIFPAAQVVSITTLTFRRNFFFKRFLKYTLVILNIASTGAGERS